MTYKEFYTFIREWSNLEKESVTITFCDPGLTHLTLHGIRNPTVDTPISPYVSNCGFHVPVESPVNLLITDNGPCRQCPIFLRKLVLLSQKANTSIQGILERFSGRGYSIHDIQSYRTSECLGLYSQRLLIDLIAHTEVNDNTHDKQCLLTEPCSHASECSRLCDQGVLLARDKESYRARLLLIKSEIEQNLQRLETEPTKYN